MDNDTTLAIFASRYLDTVTIQELINWLDDPSPEVRTLVARKLQCKGTIEVFDLSKEWAISEIDYQRELAAFILGQLGCLFEDKYPFKSATKPILVNLVNDENSEVRAAAIAAFGHLYSEGLDEDIEKLILRYSNDPSLEVKISIAITLGNSSGNEQVRHVYQEYLNENGELAEWAEVGLEILEDRLNAI
ncbi:HEAT repeat domain-containing protein [Acinetobacter sp. VNK23]|uniref:HEAT repeat domain-containing protein n=1 Tax=Acinetobacter thutiue TaxID=2998078 RepID=UPI002578CDD5|nr:HEAT repeat domain-containing protein [Acinetobacter thutiue]MDM1022259.1 HEAT repeat domain-containing protein [Acinetobacter thutiue]